jgi:H+/Cl- antiporter ClcA
MTLLVFSVLVGPVVGVLSVGYTRLFGWVAYRRVKGAPTLVMPLIAFAILGLLGIQYPQLFGNGKDIAHMVFVGSGGLGLLFALFALKPIVTAMCLGSGATGGLFTPTLATGALLGGFLGLAWSHAWPGAGVGAFAMVGAAAMIGASMQAPLAALALVVELTHSGLPIMVPMAVATVSATAISRYIDGYSIYTARLASL